MTYSYIAAFKRRGLLQQSVMWPQPLLPLHSIEHLSIDWLAALLDLCQRVNPENTARLTFQIVCGGEFWISFGANKKALQTKQKTHHKNITDGCRHLHSLFATQGLRPEFFRGKGSLDRVQDLAKINFLWPMSLVVLEDPPTWTQWKEFRRYQTSLLSCGYLLICFFWDPTNSIQLLHFRTQTGWKQPTSESVGSLCFETWKLGRGCWCCYWCYYWCCCCCWWCWDTQVWWPPPRCNGARSCAASGRQPCHSGDCCSIALQLPRDQVGNGHFPPKSWVHERWLQALEARLRWWLRGYIAPRDLPCNGRKDRGGFFLLSCWEETRQWALLPCWCPPWCWQDSFHKRQAQEYPVRNLGSLHGTPQCLQRNIHARRCCVDHSPRSRS